MRSTLLALAILLPAAHIAHADVLQMPDESTISLTAKPSKGTAMKTVLREFGQPAKKYPTVGGSSKQQPPITRWDYASFSVFFENGHVVDAVVPGQPPALQRTEELQSSQR